MIQIRADEVKKGDYIHFKSYRLRVESEPTVKGNGMILKGRISTGGCENVEKWFLSSKVLNKLEMWGKL